MNPTVHVLKTFTLFYIISFFVPEMAGLGGRKKAAGGDAKKGQSSSSSRGKPLKTLQEIKEER